MARATTSKEVPTVTNKEDNKSIIVKFKRIHPEAQIPFKATQGSAGYDLTIIHEQTVYPFNIPNLVHTGVCVEIPQGYVGKIYLRSSIGAKSKIRLSNQVGIIDSDYRGEVLLPLENISRSPITLVKGTKVAQLIIEHLPDVTFEEVEELSTTERGVGGFGSTDNNNNNKNIGVNE